MKKTRFISNDSCGLKVRAQEGEEQSRTIEGRPIVFGVRSRNLTPWSSTRKVYEVLEPGCITQELLQRSDVLLNTNHRTDVGSVLGRYRNDKEKDTLTLELRSDGIDCRCDLPNTGNANDTLELIRMNIITGMSFAFEDDWEDTENGVSYERTAEVEDGKEVWLRHVKRITALYDVSIVTHPAYEQTTVTTREASDAIDAAIEAQIKREAAPATDPDPATVPGGSAAGEGNETPEQKAEREAREKQEREAAELEARKQREREMQAARQRARQRIMTSNYIEITNY